MVSRKVLACIFYSLQLKTIGWNFYKYLSAIYNPIVVHDLWFFFCVVLSFWCQLYSSNGNICTHCASLRGNEILKIFRYSVLIILYTGVILVALMVCRSVIPDVAFRPIDLTSLLEYCTFFYARVMIISQNEQWYMALVNCWYILWLLLDSTCKHVLSKSLLNPEWQFRIFMHICYCGPVILKDII